MVSNVSHVAAFHLVSDMLWMIFGALPLLVREPLWTRSSDRNGADAQNLARIEWRKLGCG